MTSAKLYNSKPKTGTKCLTLKEQEKAVLEALENKISSMEKYIQASWDTTQRNYKLTSENKSIFNKLQGIF